MDNERLNTSPSGQHNAKHISEERKKEVEELLRKGTPVLEVAKLAKMSPNNVTAIKKAMPESTGLRDEFKATTVRNLKAFVQRASQKLVDELDNLHVSQVPIAMGIAIDKIQTLQDQPQAVVEHRFSVSHEALDKLLKAKGKGAKFDKEGAIEAELAQERPQSTAKFLDWAKDPKEFLGKTGLHDNPSRESQFPELAPPPPPSDDGDEAAE
jgi:hypothetical protein